jgi:glycosyltransferase involved in cell wall biosynthesis
MDSIPPVPNLGRGAPRQNSILRVLSDLDFEITFLYRQGEIVAWNEVLDKIPMGGLELVGPLNDVLLKVFFESRKELYETILVSRIENLIWLFKNNLTENKNIIFDFEAVIEKDLAHLKIKYPSIFDQVKNLIFVNNRDLKLFQKYFDINISNHIIGHYFSNTSKVSIIGNSKIITLGNFSDLTSPNFEMLDWLIKNVNWSESRKLNVFGDINQNLVNNNPNIIFHGKVEKEIDVFRDARIFVSPTFNSNGIPFKLDLAGSFGIPSIISSDLANKLSWEIGVDCLAADTPLEFVSCIDSLLEDNKLSEKISNNIYNKVSGNSYEKLKEKLTFI